MEEIRKVVLIEFTPTQMFELVDGVEAYPDFLPWCDGGEVLTRTPTHTSARIYINYHGIRANFATENDNQPPSKISIHLREGPFRRLEGEWRFSALGEAACKVEFRLVYEFSSRIMEAAAGSVFRHAADTFVDAFIKRAEQTYRSL